jgi:uncharacterized protein (TIGR02145 family)
MKACPKDWHLPSNEEWTTLTDFVGGLSTAGTKLKSVDGWNYNGNGTDDWGFSALPGGYGNSNNYFYGVGSSGNWWSSSVVARSMMSYQMSYLSAEVFRLGHDNGFKFSVRCVQDVDIASFKAKVKKGSFTDSRDGKGYKTVEFDNRTWMAENLNYNADDSKCYDNSESNCQKYGRLYNWKTALTACPSGWHLPSDKEWRTIVGFAGGAIAGTILKATSGWADYYAIGYGNTSGNGADAFGFSALPGGSGRSNGDFDNDVGGSGYWWSATEGNAANAWGRRMSYVNADVYRYDYDKAYLFSVRCVQD